MFSNSGKHLHNSPNPLRKDSTNQEHEEKHEEKEEKDDKGGLLRKWSNKRKGKKEKKKTKEKISGSSIEKYLEIAKRAQREESFSDLTGEERKRKALKEEEEAHSKEDDRKDHDSAFEEEEQTINEWIKREIEHSKINCYPKLNILILIVGSRGDVQPFISLAQGLLKKGHKVRLATHKDFEEFVKKNGVDFFPLAGDPKELMAFMVRHPDMITFDREEIRTQRNMMSEIFDSVWEAAGSGDPAKYRPDVIISNPPVQVHVHVAAALQVPLHLMFTMPWSPTDDYVHPLSPNRGSSLYGNKRSYWVVDELIWMGMKNTINEFRKEKLGLDKCLAGSQIVHDAEIPHVYCMSPSLAVKPSDWGKHIDVVGFWTLSGSGDTGYTPPKELTEFLEKGEPPIYIGFGSIVVDDPNALTETIFEAVKNSGVRAIISEGWGGIGAGMKIPDNIYLIGPCPHSWLFAKCFAVCHHGGAGTTATGLIAGKPTIIVPFFGDQPFWGHCVNRAGCGPVPVPIKELNSENLAAAIEYCKDPKVTEHAVKLGLAIANEDGVEKGIECFHKRLPMNSKGEWVEEMYEYQRYIPLKGWTNVFKHRVLNRYHYMDRTATIRLKKERFVLPKGWEWTSDWKPDADDTTDPEGWRYKFGHSTKAYHKEQQTVDRHRRRRWIRTRKQVDE